MEDSFHPIQDHFPGEYLVMSRTIGGEDTSAGVGRSTSSTNRVERGAVHIADASWLLLLLLLLFFDDHVYLQCSCYCHKKSNWSDCPLGRTPSQNRGSWSRWRNLRCEEVHFKIFHMLLAIIFQTFFNTTTTIVTLSAL